MEESVKLRPTSKNKEKRHHILSDNQSKKINKPQMNKNDVSQLALKINSTIGKVLNETNKIVNIGTEKELVLQEKDSVIQNSAETIDNLRKNIIHLQMEYEKLDQNYQKEILQRSEILKRMDVTRIMVDDAVQYSNKLSISIKQLEDDKIKIAEFYDLIYNGQKEIEERHSKLLLLMKERENKTIAKIKAVETIQDKILSQNSGTIAQLNQKLITTLDDLKMTVDENKHLHSQLKECKQSLDTMETSLGHEQKLNNLRKATVNKYKLIAKSARQRKAKLYIMWTKRNKEFLNIKKKLENLQKSNVELKESQKEFSLIIEKLKTEKKECESKFAELMELNTNECHNWESQKKDLVNQMSMKENIMTEVKKENEDLKKVLSQSKENENIVIAENNVLRKNLTEIQIENEQYKEVIKELRKENDKKEKAVSGIEDKLKNLKMDSNLKIDLYKKETRRIETMVKKLENELEEERKKLLFERTERDVQMKDLTSSFNEKMTVEQEKIQNLEKEVNEKDQVIAKLNSDITSKNSSLDLLNYELSKYTELNKNLVENLDTEKAKNKILNSDLDKTNKVNEGLRDDLEKFKREKVDLEKKLNEERFSKESLQSFKNNLEKNMLNLKAEIEQEKSHKEHLREMHRKAEIECSKMEKVVADNSDLKKVLEETEAKVEAYKIVIKKLESEKKNQTEETLKMESEINRLQEMLTKGHHKTEPEHITPKKKDVAEQKIDSKIGNVEKLNQGSLTPLQNTRKFLSTPRKILSSTPNPGHGNLSSLKKKRDPYEFESDSSVERFDPDQALKVFKNRQKKDTNKRLRPVK